MSFSYLHLEDRGAVRLLRFVRPPANAIDLTLATELAAAAEELLDAPCKAVVLTGSDTCFSAGADVKLVPSYSAEQKRALIHAINRLAASFYACPKPIVAAISGHAIGGGLMIALCADYRVSTASPCKLALTEARAGIPFPAAPMAVLRAELSPPVARVLALRALPMDPEAALASGVVDELAPQDRVLPRALEIAEDLAAFPPETYARVKLDLRANTIAKVQKAAHHDEDPMLDGWQSEGPAPTATRPA